MKKIAVLLLLGLVIQVKAQVSFAPPVTYPVGAQPQGVITADINGDGKADLVCANAGDGTLTILTNNGVGGFALASAPVVGSYPINVTAADVNGDGIIDLVSANYGADTISILTNNGSGGFTQASCPAVGSLPYSVLAADVNGDGKMDLVVVNSGSGTLSILTNNAAGGFVLASSPAVGSGPVMATVADLFNDGRQELIVANSGDNTLSILTNSGYGTFGTMTLLSVGGNPMDVIAVDVNGDGYLDLVTANAGGGSGDTLTILTNNQMGGFVPASSPQVGQNDCVVMAADFNGDGKPDLASVNISGSLTVLTNDGSGGFAVATNISESNCYGGVAVDVNGDGKVDMVGTSRGDSTLSVFRNTTIIEAPVITVAPTNQPVLAGWNTNFSVVAAGISPLSYQWYFVPTNNPGQAGAYAQSISDFVYGAVVTNGGYGYGNIPHVSFVGGGGSGASGYGIVSNGMVIGITVTNAGSSYSSLPAVVIDPPNGILTGQTNSFLTISNAGPNSLGNYFVVVSNQYGSVASGSVNLSLLYPPAITTNPIGFSAAYHSSNSLTVYASGSTPLSYQWQLNGTNLAGATGSSYAIASLNFTSAGVYTVTVFSPYGTAYGSPVKVEVAPTLTSPFAGAVGVEDQNTSLGVVAVGSGTLSYQWYFDGQAIAGATGSVYDLSQIQFTNAGWYNVVVSSAYGSVTNAACQVVVYPPAGITLGTCPLLYLQGTPGSSYTIQSSTNLANPNAWVTATNLTLPYTPYLWADTATDTTLPSNPHKFYRLISAQ